jgi:hypothetical protein
MNAVVFETVVTDEHQLHCALPASLPTGCRLRVVIEPIAEEEPTRTELWRQLMALREQAITEGMPLMDWDEINAEVCRRQGGAADE